MSLNSKRLLAAAIVGSALLSAIFWIKPKDVVSAPVATTVFPLYDITRNIVGGTMPVSLILPPGASPHTFEPTPSKIRELQNAKVVYAVGYGLDDWVDAVIPPQAAKITTDKGVKLREAAPDSDETGADPHYWLTVPNAKLIARTIALDLADRFPDSAPIFKDNLADYETRLDDADAGIRAIIDASSNKKIVTLHDAWYYFADAYGLTIVGSFEPAAGREPTPQYLAKLGAAISRAQTKTLFTEPGVSVQSLESFITDNDLTVEVLDPIEGLSAQDTYINLMLKNAAAIKASR